MTAPKKAGIPVSPFLNVPTLIATNTLRPSGSMALTSAQAVISRQVPSGAAICSPHSVSCQTTPAWAPKNLSNQPPNGWSGNCASSSEAGIACTEENTCFSNDSICVDPATEPQRDGDRAIERQRDRGTERQRA